MKVAYLVNHYPKVSHTFIRREIHALEKQGVEVVRLAVRGWDDPAPDPQDQAEKAKTSYLLQGAAALAGAVLKQALRAPGRLAAATAMALRLGRRSDRPWPYHLIYLAEACVAADRLRGSGVTHVHAHFGTNSAEVALLLHALGGPGYSFTVHGPEEFDKPEFLHLGEKIRRARFVVAISSFGRSQLYRWVDRLNWYKVHVVHCGLEPAFHQVQTSPPAGRQLLCVGRLSEQKGHLLLIEAAALLAAQETDFQLVLAGDGELRGPIEARIEQLGLQRHVRITGWITSDQVRAEMLASRALVLASFAEGLPVVAMESMALARPVVGTSIAGMPELVLPGDNGWLVPAGDAPALASAMLACLRHPDADLRDMGERARLKALAQHDIDTEAGHLAALFREHEHA